MALGNALGLVLESLETKFNATTFIGQAAEGVNFHAAFNGVLGRTTNISWVDRTLHNFRSGVRSRCRLLQDLLDLCL